MRDPLANGHVQLGETDTIKMPPGFNAPDTGATVSGIWDQEVPSDGQSNIFEYDD